MSLMTEQIEGYEQWMCRKNLTEASRRTWLSAQRRFCAWWARPLNEATTADLEEWLFEVMDHLSPASVVTYRKALRSLFTWALREGLVSADPSGDVISPRLPARAPNPTPTPMVRAALATAEPRTRAMVCLAAYQGMRVGEIQATRWSDIDGSVILVHGKGQRERRLPLHPESSKALAVLSRPHGDVIFEGGYYHVSRTIVALMREMGCDRVRPAHALRAWFATALFAETRDIVLVSQLLGHASLEQTRLYVQSPTDAAQAVAALSA